MNRIWHPKIFVNKIWQSDVLKKLLVRQLKHQIDGPAFIAIGVATAAVISATDRCHAAEWFANRSRNLGGPAWPMNLKVQCLG